MFSGYANESNDDVFTSDGYFQTGDLGYLDSEDYLYVTGRKKEVIVLSNGKNVSPNKIEAQLIQSEYINQVVVTGNDRHYLTALIVPDFDRILLADSSFDSDPLLLCENAAVIQLIKQDILQCSASLAGFETVKKFVLLPTELSIDGGELTPTLKLRRSFINKKFQDFIDSLYNNQ